MNIALEAKTNDYRLNDPIGNLQPFANSYEVAIDSLNQYDEIKIYTAGSEYRFTLTDPCSLTGSLAGGQLGEGTLEAQLVAVREGAKLNLKDELSIIGEGMRLIFYFLADDRNLVTSPIKRLALLKHKR